MRGTNPKPSPNPDLGKPKAEEIVCAACGGHIGHVFHSPFHPPPHQERHCVNSLAVRFLTASTHSTPTDAACAQERLHTETSTARRCWSTALAAPEQCAAASVHAPSDSPLRTSKCLSEMTHCNTKSDASAASGCKK